METFLLASSYELLDSFPPVRPLSMPLDLLTVPGVEFTPLDPVALGRVLMLLQPVSFRLGLEV